MAAFCRRAFWIWPCLGLASAVAAQEAGFLKNAGQWPEQVAFRRLAAGTRTWFTREAIVIDLGPRRAEDLGRSHALSLEFVGASGAPILGEKQLPGAHNFLRGADPDAWHTGVPSFERIVYHGLWPGIDLVARKGAGAFEYDLHLEPGAVLEDARFRVRGGWGLSLSEGGLVIATSLGDLRQSPPVAWSVKPGQAPRPLVSRFVLLGEAEFSFEVEGAPVDATIIIDPGLEWSTFVGGFDEDIPEDLVFAFNGDCVICGSTLSSPYPVTMGAIDSTANGARDAFVTRLKADGKTLVFSTLLGGSGADFGRALELANAGQVWMAGDSDSPDFPSVAGASDTTPNGASDVFVVRLGPSGATLISSTFYGAAGEERARDLALTPSHEPVVVGWTLSTALPVSATAFDPTASGGRDGFVASWTADLSALRFASYIGGSGNDMAQALALGPGGTIYLAGLASSFNFPTTAGAFDTTHNSGSASEDGFVASLTADASGMLFSTFLGGSAGDSIEAMALAPGGDLWLAGTSDSADLPTSAGALEPNYQGLGDGFVARLSGDGSSLVHGTYLAGAYRDRALDIAVDAAGRVVVVGETRSGDFPTTLGALDRSFNSPQGAQLADVFVVRLEPSGSLEYGTYLGGVDDDAARAVALDGAGGVAVAGTTNSFNYPTTFGSYSVSYDLSYLFDGFVTRMDFARHPYNFGAAKINSLSWWAVLGYGGFPSLSGGDFMIYLDGGIAFSYAFMFWSTQAGSTPFMGGEILMRPPFARSHLLPLDWFGSAFLAPAIDASMVGSTFYYQAWYADSGDPFGVGLSDGLEVTYYP